MKPRTTVKIIGLLIALAILVWYLHSSAMLAAEQEENRVLQQRLAELRSGGGHGR